MNKLKILLLLAVALIFNSTFASTQSVLTINSGGTVVNASPIIFPNGLIVGGNGNVLTNILKGNLVWVDKVNGNNSTAKRGDEHLPSSTILNAVQLAQPGDTVMVLPGTYNENNLRKPGVNFYGYPGANIFYQHSTTNDAGWGIFDDRSGAGWGASTNYIDWQGTLGVQGFTNFGLYGNAWNDDGLQEECNNFVGVLVQTNPASILRGHIGGITTPFLEAGTPQSAAVYFPNGGDIDNKSILDIGFISSQPTNYAAVMYAVPGTETGVVSIVTTVCSGIIWGNGDLSVNCPLIDEQEYGIWCEQFVTNRINHFDFDGDQLYGKIYTTAANQNLVGWFRFNQEQPPSINDANPETDYDDNGFITNIVFNGALTYGAATAIDVFGSGKWYFENIGKISIPGYNYGIKIYEDALPTVHQNPELWYTGEKIEADAGSIWLSQDWGITHFTLQHWASNGGGGIVIETNTGYGYGYPICQINSQQITGTDADGIKEGQTSAFKGLLKMDGGQLIIQGASITNLSGNFPLFLTSKGLTLQDDLIQSPTGFPAIGAITGQSVLVLGGGVNTAFTNTLTVYGYTETNLLNTPTYYSK